MVPRIAGLVVAVLAVLLIVLAVPAYERMVEDISLPTGGVTEGPGDAVPTGEAAEQALAVRARLQGLRGGGGPLADRAAAQGADQAAEQPAATETPTTPQGQPDEQSGEQPAATHAPEMQPWITATPSEFWLNRERSFVAGTTSLPDPKAGVLIQERGRDWRRFHNTEVTVGGGIAVLAVLALLGLFLALRGRVRLDRGFSGQWVPRFDGYERFNHWMTAISFIMLALTGLILLYGQFFLRPLMGAAAYSEVAYFSVPIHIGFAIPFVLGVLGMLAFWVRQNGFNKADMVWLKKGGGMLFKTRSHPPAYRFNAGQKLIFWGVMLGAVVLTASGVTLMFPFFWLDIAGMQLTLIVHAIAALAMVAMILGHIYIGTVGMEGAFDAMWSGEVDRNWAYEHHQLWMAEDRGQRPPPVRGSPEPRLSGAGSD